MGKKVRTNRQIQAAETKDRIYQAAIELLESKGFENMTISEISRKAEVSVGTFYLYFSSKTDILAEVFKQAYDFFLNEVAPLVKGKPAPQQIMEYFSKYVALNISNGVKTTKHLFSPNVKFFIQNGRAMHTILVDIVREGQARNEIRSDIPAEEVERFLFVNAWGTIFEWNLHNGKIDLKDATEKRVSLLVSALLPAPQEGG